MEKKHLCMYMFRVCSTQLHVSLRTSSCSTIFGYSIAIQATLEPCGNTHGGCNMMNVTLFLLYTQGEEAIGSISTEQDAICVPLLYAPALSGCMSPDGLHGRNADC